MRVFWYLLFVPLAAGGAGAQPLDVAPDTLFYQAEDTVTITNPASAPVTLDSVTVEDTDGSEYHVRLAFPDTTLEDRLRRGRGGTSVGVPLAPGRAASFSIVYADLCTACRNAQIEPDTLLFYSGGVAVPDTVVVDFSRFVSARPAPDAAPPVRVAAFPNPAADRLTLRVEADRPAAGEVVVTDALGRVVWRRRLVATAIANIPLPVREFAAGPYRVHVLTVEGGAEASFTVVR